MEGAGTEPDERQEGPDGGLLLHRQEQRSPRRQQEDCSQRSF